MMPIRPKPYRRSPHCADRATLVTMTKRGWRGATLLGVVFGLLLFGTGSPVLALDLAAAAQYSAARRGSAVVVYQDGRERYAQGQNGFDLRQPHLLASGSKSFACAIAVAAQDDGLLDLEERVSDTVAEWRSDPLKAEVTVRQLLNFTSGLPGDAADPRTVPRLANLNTLAIGLPLVAAPGTRYTYGNAHLAVFNEVIRRKTKEQADAYLWRRVLEPIGVAAIRWSRDRAGNAQLAGGAFVTARDWASFGRLVLNDGVWQGKQILSSSRLSSCRQGSQALSIYGLTWWLNVPVRGNAESRAEVPRILDVSATSSGRVAPSAPGDTFMAAGAGNQRLYVVPSLRLVVVRFGEGGPWSDDEFLARLLR